SPTSPTRATSCPTRARTAETASLRSRASGCELPWSGFAPIIWPIARAARDGASLPSCSPQMAASDAFGYTVALDGDTALIGAYLDDERGTNSGSAHVFRRVGGAWMQAAKLLASDGGASDVFGHSVSISGDMALIGAHGDDDRGLDAGAAYVFRNIGGVWLQTAKLLATDGQAGDNFGISVALDGGVALVGAALEDDRGANAGAAYTFRDV